MSFCKRELQARWAVWLCATFPSRADAARAFGTSPRTVDYWIAQTVAPSATALATALRDHPGAAAALLGMEMHDAPMR